MNKIILGLSMLAVISLFITGCNKEEKPPIADTPVIPQEETVEDKNNVPKNTDNTIVNNSESSLQKPQKDNEDTNAENTVSYRYFLIKNDGRGIATPSAKLCSSSADILSYTKLLSTGYDLGEDTYRWSFSGFTRKYDEEFFKDNVVLFILIDEDNSNVSHKVTSVKTKNNDLIVDILRENTDRYSETSAQWNVALELPKSVESAENFIINMM